VQQRYNEVLFGIYSGRHREPVRGGDEVEERGVYVDRTLGEVRAVASDGKCLALLFIHNGNMPALIADAFEILDRHDALNLHDGPLPPPRHLRLID